MEKARQIIREVLAGATNPAVFCSFGKDSMLLLSLVREIKPDVSVLWFRSGGREDFAKRVIMDWDLDVWSWEPADVYVLPNENGLSVVREQSFGLQRFPVVLDVEEGNRCIADFMPGRTSVLYPHFDVLFLGYRDSDEHWVLGGKGFCPEDGWALGKAKVYAPLRHMNDGQVWAAIKELSVPVDEERYFHDGNDPDSLPACTRCLQEGATEVWCLKEGKYIPRVGWDREESLRAFRDRFGFKEAA
jgi:hypothetical protein